MGAGPCTMTPLEWALRRHAGQQGHAGSFVDHYLGALIYPDGLTPTAQWRIALLLLAVNLLFYGVAWRRLQRRRRMP